MLPIVLVSSVLVSLGIVLAGVLIFSAAALRRRLARERAAVEGVTFARAIGQRGSFQDRAIAKLPPSYVDWLSRQLVLAGRPEAWTLAKIVGVKALLSFVGLVFAIVWFVGEPSLNRALVSLAVLGVAFYAPDFLLRSRASERQRLITEELPDTLDQMTVAVEAGLGFDSAMSKVAGAGTGPIAEEFMRTLQDMSLGMSRREAYEALGARTSSEDLRRFTRSIAQAETYGIAVARVLRVQSGEMRLKRKQVAEERAMKIPVKIVFPLTVCILPVLFIVVLTPAVMNMIEVFSQ